MGEREGWSKAPSAAGGDSFLGFSPVAFWVTLFTFFCFAFVLLS